ncbi:L,D-transpeptidase [Leifsonia sp. NPDC080035]|uniref:L,D-transpeptidase n=1 Tax=Leifsonia sp. NPDC080035 TaxID=3143936 RepID=A0AAU7GAP5_9MICO
MTSRLPVAALCIAALAVLAGCSTTDSRPTASASATSAASSPSASTTEPPSLTSRQVIVLPAAVYKAVVHGLLTAPADISDVTAYTLRKDAPLYGADRSTPIARLPMLDFLAEPTVVDVVRTDGPWALALTPARSILPSKATATAPATAQTAAWLPTSYLQEPRKLTGRVEISVSARTLSILTPGSAAQTFTVGVGTPETPTPTGVTGYLQARYTDADQDQTDHRIQLTSLHATGADEPYGGHDGGLIGIHFQETSSGAVSHGCIRMDAAGVQAVDALPLGTLVTVVP